MPPQRQRHQLTTEELSRVMGILECGSSQQGFAIIFGVSQSVTPRAWNRLQTSGSATQCHAGGRQWATTPIQDRFLVVQARRHPFVNATTLRNELRNAVGVNISTQNFITVFNGVAFGLGENAFASPWPDFTNRCAWTGHDITSTGLITIVILSSSPMSKGTVLTLQIDVFDCGEDVGSDFKMPICLNMTAMEEAPSWFGLISAEVDEHTHTSW